MKWHFRFEHGFWVSLAILGLSSAMRRQKHESLSIVPYAIGKGLSQWIGLRANWQENPSSLMGTSMVSCRISLKPNHWYIHITRFPKSWRYPMSWMVFWWKILERNAWFGDPPFVETTIYAYCAEKSGNTRGSFQIFWFQSRKNAGQSSWSPDHVMLRGMADELSSRYCR